MKKLFDVNLVCPFCGKLITYNMLSFKAKHECENNNKKMCLPFRFKDDADIYVIMDFEDLVDIVTELKAYKAENLMLKEKLSEWN